MARRVRAQLQLCLVAASSRRLGLFLIIRGAADLVGRLFPAGMAANDGNAEIRFGGFSAPSPARSRNGNARPAKQASYFISAQFDSFRSHKIPPYNR